MRKKKFVWENGDIEIIKKVSSKSFESDLLEHLTLTGEKYNPWHDNLGRFASGSGGGSGLTHVPDKRNPGGTGGTATAEGKPEEFKKASNSELNKYYNLKENCG